MTRTSTSLAKWTKNSPILSTATHDGDEHSLAHDAMSGGGSCGFGSGRNKKEENDGLKVVAAMDAITRHGS